MAIILTGNDAVAAARICDREGRGTCFVISEHVVSHFSREQIEYGFARFIPHAKVVVSSMRIVGANEGREDV